MAKYTLSDKSSFSHLQFDNQDFITKHVTIIFTTLDEQILNEQNIIVVIQSTGLQ